MKPSLTLPVYIPYRWGIRPPFSSVPCSPGCLVPSVCRTSTRWRTRWRLESSSRDFPLSTTSSSISYEAVPPSSSAHLDNYFSRRCFLLCSSSHVSTPPLLMMTTPPTPSTYSSHTYSREYQEFVFLICIWIRMFIIKQCLIHLPLL